MKIFLLAPIHREMEYLKQKHPLPFLLGQGQQSWVEAFQELDQKVVIFKYSDSILIPNVLRMYIKYFIPSSMYSWFKKLIRKTEVDYLEEKLKNKRLCNLILKQKPDLVIISSGADFVDSKILQKTKERRNFKVYLFAGVNPKYAVPENELEMVKQGLIDVVVENDEGYAQLWKKLGARKVLVLPISSVDPKIHKKMAMSKGEVDLYKSDVCFVGSLTAVRQKILAQLTDFDLAVWGDLPENTSINKSLKKFYKGQAFGKKMVKIFNASKIALNFQPEDMLNGGNMRTFEIPGCGAFQLADRVDKRWFANMKEVILFKDVKDLKSKIKYYLDNEKVRMKIAKQGHIHAHKKHTYEKHFKSLLP